MIGDGGADQTDFGLGIRGKGQLIFQGGQGAVPEGAVDKAGGAKTAAAATAAVDFEEKHAAEFSPGGLQPAHDGVRFQVGEVRRLDLSRKTGSGGEAAQSAVGVVIRLIGRGDVDAGNGRDQVFVGGRPVRMAGIGQDVEKFSGLGVTFA